MQKNRPEMYDIIRHTLNEQIDYFGKLQSIFTSVVGNITSWFDNNY